MSNDEVYATGLLNRALDPNTQPTEVRAFMRAEFDLLDDLIPRGARVLDVGCGTGRHLRRLSDRLEIGVGVDYEHSYITVAQRQAEGALHFITADATQIPLRPSFDFAICLTNTWGTMGDQPGVLREMRRLAARPHTRLLTVFSLSSIAARHEWYRRFGHSVAEETSEYLVTDGGLRSEHFSEARLRSIAGDCSIQPLSDIGYVVRF